MQLPLKTRSNSAFRLIYHLVLVTKFRRQSLTTDILERMQLILRDLFGKWECDLIEFGGEADHIHLLFETHPSVELSKLVNNIKTVTSRRLRSEYGEHLSQFYWGSKPQFWSSSYAIISVGAQAPLERLIEYVRTTYRICAEPRKARMIRMLRLYLLVSLTPPKSDRF